VAADWPEFAQLRPAASALQKSRLIQAVSIVVNELRVALASAALGHLGSAQPDDQARAEQAEARAARLLGHARAIVSDGALPLREKWHLTEAQRDLVIGQLSTVVGPATDTQQADGAGPSPQPVSGPRPERCAFQQGVHLFLAAIAQGTALTPALKAFRVLDAGAYSYDGRCFYPDAPQLGPLADRPSVLSRAVRWVIRGAEGEHDTTLFMVEGLIAAVVSPRPLQIRWADDLRRAAGGLESLPDFIALPRDELGRPILPKSRVTALVEARAAWAVELGSLDAVTQTITEGRLVMPKVSAPTQQTTLRNHPSWENDEKAKKALGPVIAKWLASGVLEYVSWNDRLPVLLQPCGAVPKGTAPFYRLITDARFGNNMYADWGVTYTTAAQLSSTLNRCDFTFSVDISDAYHLAVWAGCGGQLRTIRRPVLADSDGPGGRLTWIDALVNGCTPSTCVGGCDKDMSGIMIEGHVFRFASCQFGQKTAGSPLGAVVRSVARYFARLPDPVHVAAWVDDLIFVMNTPEHGDCPGFEGGCEVCAEYHGRALEVQAMWRRKAAALNIPLSEKGHEVSQQGSFTGVGIDTLRGIFHMLPDKLKSLFTALGELCASSDTTPRLISRVRGKLLHYGAAIPYVALAAPTLSQCMHDREKGIGPTKVPTLSEEDAQDFDWDQQRVLSARARRALSFAVEAATRFGESGQPIWPAVASSLYGAFLDRRLGPIRVLVISYDASVHGWGSVLRTSPDEDGLIVVGGYREAMEDLGTAYLHPAQLGDDPAAQVYRETLAGFLATKAAGQHFRLADFTVLLRGDCTGALAALRKGSFRSPALQDVALAFNEFLMLLGVRPPCFLHAPGTVMKSEGIDHLSREVAAERRALESTSALRELVLQEAQRLGGAISIDLFATAENTLVPRFYARFPEHLAEGADALAQPDWGASSCPHCLRMHRETAFAFPPRPLLDRFLAKARADGLRGVLVIPFTTSSPVWPSIMAASLTPPSRGKDPCIVVPASSKYVRHNSEFAGVQRLAVLAVDFARASGRDFSACAPVCEGHSRHRPRPSLVSPLDDADRTRIRAAVRRLGLDGRPPAVGPKRPRAGP
jgi:hypothetical protein